MRIFNAARAAAALSVAAAGTAHAQVYRALDDEPSVRAAVAVLDRSTRPTLTRFGSDAEFETYLEAWRGVGRAEREVLNARDRERAAQGTRPSPPSPQPPPVAPAPVAGAPAGEPITVTGSRITARNASITNNQMRGVDEGDIVKQMGRHLLILTDGRIFVVDTMPGGRPGLALADRIEVYRDPLVGTWFDEMLVFGDRIVVGGYSYDDGETEISVFRLGADGRLQREGVFTRRSDDYYSASNYATRIIGDSLVLYSIFDISRLDDRDRRFGLGSMQLWAREAEDRPRRTRRRHWSDRDEPAPAPTGPRLLDANATYRPVRTEQNPSIHAVSICPLAAMGRDALALPCRSTAFVGPETTQLYVTAEESLLWAYGEGGYSDEDCSGPRPPLHQVLPAVLFRVPHDGSAPGVAGARGRPFDQFSMQVNDGRLRALVDRWTVCERDLDHAEPLYVETPLSSFGPALRDLGAEAYTEMPAPGTTFIVNRFTERHLVYGGLSSYRRGLPDIDWDDYANRPESLAWRRRMVARPPAFVVPAGRPTEVAQLDIGHTVVRAERYGENDVLLTGYRDRRGLTLSLIDLDGPPRIGASTELRGRYESEGRSHAFNSMVGPDGAGIIGLPTSPDRYDSRRSPSRSHASDISFLSVREGRRLSELGELSSSLLYARARYDEETDEETNKDGLDGYECEVSCIDWYGNSRPIFTDGRIFALTGAELVEGRRAGDRMVETRRIDFLRSPLPRR